MPSAYLQVSLELVVPARFRHEPALHHAPTVACKSLHDGRVLFAALSELLYSAHLSH